MSIEVRRVPPDWHHPIKDDSRYQPQREQDYDERAQEWLADCILWAKGEHPDQQDRDDPPDAKYFWDWDGGPPDEAYYRTRKWTPEEATHYQMYESVSEGTPISPVCESPEALARWLADNQGKDWLSDRTSYAQWLRMIERGGQAPSCVVVNNQVMSGVEFVASDLCKKVE